MGRVLGIIAVVLVALVGGAAAFIYFAGPDRIARYAERRMSETTGREVRIAGPVDIDWSWSPRITVGGITMSNADWGSEPRMVSLGQLETVVRIWPLLRGKIELPEIIVDKPDILLERNKDGVGNWVFDVPAEAEAAAEAASPEDRSEFPVIGTLQVRDGRFRFIDQPKKIDIDSRISTTVASGTEGEEQLHIEGKGSIEGRPLRLELTGAPLLTLRESETPYPLKLDVKLGDTSLKAEGTLLEPVKLRGVDMRLDMNGGSLADSYALLGVPFPATGKYRIATRLIREGEVWKAEEIDGKVGESDLKGWLTFEPKQERPLIRADLRSEKLDLADLGGLVGLAPGQEDTDGKIIPDTPINLERLKAVDMEVAFKGGNIQGPLPLDAVQATLDLKNGRARVDPLKFTMALGTVGGNVVLDGSKTVPALATNLEISNVKLKPFFKDTPFEEETAGTLGGHIDLRGSGKSFSDIMGAADGDIAMVMAGGQVSALILEGAGIDIAEALGILISKDEPVAVRCMVAAFGVNDGIMKAKTLVLDTEDTNIAGDMEVALGKETMRGRIEAHPKDATIASGRTPVTFGGTFMEPKVGIEAGPLAAKGAAAVALGALLTPLAALIPLVDLGGGEDSPCGELISNAKAGNQGKPVNPGKPDQGPSKEPSKKEKAEKKGE
ncbi:MAG TPA: AsmA family protein [Azospirillaceae bacterium]|nr:AsmA family protein [Azospirillaceae bacterium]